MSNKLVWDAAGERIYETGTKKGVLYPQENGAYPEGFAWNGLTAFSESPDGGEANDIYADDIKYLSLRSKENFKGTIEAYTYPDQFAACNGEAALLGGGVTIGQQTRKPFGFSYVSTIGNDQDYDDHGYKIHLIWGATAAPSEKSYQTINDSPEAITFSWEIDTIPVEIDNDVVGATYKPTAHMEIDSTKWASTEVGTGDTLSPAAKLALLEDVLYGTDGTSGHDAMLPSPTQVIQILKNGTIPEGMYST